MALDAAMSDRLSDLLSKLFGDEAEAAKFEADPDAYLTGAGLGEVTGDDVAACMPAVAEEHGWDLGADVNTNAGGDVTQNAGGGGGGGAAWHGSPATKVIHDYHTQYVGATTQIANTYNTNTTNVQDNDTVYDNSVETGDIYANGDVTFDNDQAVANGDGSVANTGSIDGAVNTGDGGVAVGGDNSGQIQTGDGIQVGGDVSDSTLISGDVGGDVIAGNEDSVIGDHNSGIITGDDNDGSFAGSGNSGVVVGDDNTTGFGSGDVIDSSGGGNVTTGDGNVVDTTVEDGSAVSTGGDATGSNVEVDISDSFNETTTITDSFDVEDSFNTTDSFNDESVDVDVDVDLPEPAEAAFEVEGAM